MSRYLIRRILIAVPSLLGISLVLFAVLAQPLAGLQQLFLEPLVFRQQLFPIGRELVEESPHFGFVNAAERLREFAALDINGCEFHVSPSPRARGGSAR